MSLNQIHLTSQLLTGLYPDVLVESPASSGPGKEKYSYLGKNEKNILIFVAYRENPYLPESDLLFLTNVLSACQLGLSDVAIINHLRLDEDALAVMEETGARKVIMFGIDPLTIGLPMNFPHFQLQQFNNRTFLYAPSLSELEGDKSQKGKLWGCLKTLFGL